MKRILTVCSLLLLLAGCAGMPGTNTGALVGGVAGATISRDNPIAGALIGGLGGAIIGNIFDNNSGRAHGHPGHRDYYDGYDDRAYYERIRRQRAYEEQLHRQRLQQLHWQRQQQQRYYGGGHGCYRCR